MRLRQVHQPGRLVGDTSPLASDAEDSSHGRCQGSAPNRSLNAHLVVFHRTTRHAAGWALFTPYMAAQLHLQIVTAATTHTQCTWTVPHDGLPGQGVGTSLLIYFNCPIQFDASQGVPEWPFTVGQRRSIWSTFVHEYEKCPGLSMGRSAARGDAPLAKYSSEGASIFTFFPRYLCPPFPCPLILRPGFDQYSRKYHGLVDLLPRTFGTLLVF